MKEKRFARSLKGIKEIIVDNKVTLVDLKNILKAYNEVDKQERKEFINFLKMAEMSENLILKENAITILRYFLDTDKRFFKYFRKFKGKTLWKSKTYGRISTRFTIPFGIFLFSVVSFGLIDLFYNLLMFPELVIATIIIVVILGGISVYFIILPLVSYIIIYENGITMRAVLNYYKVTYYPIEMIKSVKLLKTGVTFAHAINSWRKIDPRGKIRITEMNEEFQELSIAWVSKLDIAKKLIQDLLESRPDVQKSVLLKDFDKNDIKNKIMVGLILSAIFLIPFVITSFIVGYFFSDQSFSDPFFHEVGLISLSTGWILTVLDIILWIFIYIPRNKESSSVTHLVDDEEFEIIKNQYHPLQHHPLISNFGIISVNKKNIAFYVVEKVGEKIKKIIYERKSIKTSMSHGELFEYELSLEREKLK